MQIVRCRLQYGLLFRTELHGSTGLIYTKGGSVQVFVRSKICLDSCKQVLSNNNGEKAALFKAAGRSLKSQREVLTNYDLEQCNLGCTPEIRLYFTS